MVIFLILIIITDAIKAICNFYFLKLDVFFSNLLNGNDYILHLALDCGSPRKCHHSILDVFKFSIIDVMDEKSVARGNFSSVREDVVLWPALDWEFKKF